MGIFDQLFSSSNSAPADLPPFLESLTSLPYKERVKKIAIWAVNAPTNKATEWVNWLTKASFYEKHIATIICKHAGLQAPLIPLFSDPSTLVSTTASNSFFTCKKQDTVPSWEDVSQTEFALRNFVSHIRSHNRKDLANRFLPLLMKNNRQGLAADLLPHVSDELINTHWKELSSYGVPMKWLAINRPEKALAFLFEEIEATPPSSQAYVWNRFNLAIKQLLPTHGDQIMEYAIKYAPGNLLPLPLVEHAKKLAKRWPVTFGKLLTREAFIPHLRNFYWRGPLIKSIQYLSPDIQEIVLAQIRTSAHILIPIFKLLKKRELAGLYRSLFPNDGFGATIQLSPDILRTLPYSLRYEEARRMLAQFGDQMVFESRIAYIGLLAYPEASEALIPYKNASNEQERAAAMVQVLAAAQQNPEHLTDALTYLQKIKNDQDPVRSRVMSQLFLTPPSGWKTEHIPLLKSLVEEIYEARDSSYMTFYAIEQLFNKLLVQFGKSPQSPFFSFSLDLFKLNATKRRTLWSIPRVEGVLNKEEVELFVQSIQPIISFRIRVEEFETLFSLGFSLGKYAGTSESYQELIKPLVAHSKTHIAMRAIEFWLKNPETREVRTRELLDKEPSAVAIHSVFMVLHRHRQDWLDYYLRGKYITGRFLTGNTVWIPSADSGFYRWLPEQQRKLATYYKRIISEKDRADTARRQTIANLGFMPVTIAEDLEHFVDDSRQFIREAALAGMSNLDCPGDALPYLLAFLEKSEARVAMYAITKAIRYTPNAKVRSTLAGLLEREYLKVTVRKEVVRLLGELRLDPKGEMLRKELHKPGVHKDVCIAIGHAARAISDSPEGLALLNEVAQSPHFEVVRSLVGVYPYSLLPDVRKPYLRMLKGLATHKKPEVRLELMRSLPPWKPGNEAEVLEICESRLLSPLQGSEMVNTLALFNLITRDPGRETSRLIMIEKLLSIPLDEQSQKAGDDLPFYRRAIQLLNGIASDLGQRTFAMTAEQFDALSATLREAKILPAELLSIQLAYHERYSENFWEVLPQFAEAIQAPGMALPFQTFAQSWVDRMKAAASLPYFIPFIKAGLEAAQADALMRLKLLEICGRSQNWSAEWANLLLDFRKNSENQYVRGEAHRIELIKVV